MARHKATSANIIRVLATVLAQCVRPGEDGQFYRRFWADEINRVCDGAGDAFGTEGQDDPRGDRRD